MRIKPDSIYYIFVLMYLVRLWINVIICRMLFFFCFLQTVSLTLIAVDTSSSMILKSGAFQLKVQ